MKNNAKKKLVVVHISEEAYDFLTKIAAAMNSVGWADDDNSADTVVEGFCIDVEDRCGIKERIVDTIDTCSVRGSVVDKCRREELAKALNGIA